MLAYSIILFLAAILLLAFGIAVYRGNTKLIHDYHQTNIEGSERQEYGRAFSKGMFAISATLLVSGIVALLVKESVALTASLIVLAAGIAVSVIILVKVQKKYNGGLF